jgi:hypothetical protein
MTKVWKYSVGAFFAILSIGVLAATVAKAQDANVVSIAGKAEILEAGRRFQAKVGYKLSPGQSISLIGGGEVILTSDDGEIKIKVISGTTLRYDGRVPSDEQPWSSKRTKVKKASTLKKTTPQFYLPLGKLELEIEPGRETRVVAPLILAAVRGTKFTVTVDPDGGSRVDTHEGLVAAYCRNGDMRLTSPGKSAMVSAREYGDFLSARGVTLLKPDDWRSASTQSQESVDSATIGPIFESNGGGDLLVAVLSNPNASPTAGVNALAIESLSVEPGSLFVEASADSGSFGDAARIQPASAAVTLDSTLLDEGLPDIVAPSFVMPPDPRSGIVIGEFVLPYATLTFWNYFIFDLDFDTGQISNAKFSAGYMRPWQNLLAGSQGTGLLNLNTLNFSIQNFSSTSFSENGTSGARGTLGPNTAINGSFASPLNFGVTANGQLDLEYILDPFSPSIYDLPNYLSFSGAIGQKPFYVVSGTFDLTPYDASFLYTENNFKFTLNPFNGTIFDGEGRIRFMLGSDDSRVTLDYGVGTITSTSFSIDFHNSWAYFNLVNQGLLTANLSGSFSSPDFEVGNSISSGNLVLTFSSPTSMRSSFPVLSGQITHETH